MTATLPTTSPHELVYDIDGVRVVETRVPLWLQESYELLQSWPKHQPTPHYFPPKESLLTTILHHVQAALLGHQKTSPSPPPPVVTQLANYVRARLATIYNTSFSTYHIVKYSETSQDREGTVYVIDLQIAPRVGGHSVLVIKVFKSMTDSVLLLDHYLES